MSGVGQKVWVLHDNLKEIIKAVAHLIFYYNNQFSKNRNDKEERKIKFHFEIDNKIN